MPESRPAIVSRETTAGTPPSPVSRETPATIAVINQKGGVGKTTTAVSIAYDLAHRGYRTLLVDLDPQGNASTALGVDRHQEDLHTAYELLFDPDAPFSPTTLMPEGLHLCPGNGDLVSADLELLNLGDRRADALLNALRNHQDAYDIIIYDSPPSLGMLTVNILRASRHVLIPIQCEYLALEGLAMLRKTLDDIRGRLNPELSILGCLITMADLRTNLSQQVVTDVRTHLGPLVFDAIIPRTVRLSECPSHGQTIFQYDRWGSGARSYEALTTEILSRLDKPANLKERK